MPKPRPLPELPSGWFWHPGSQVTNPNYLDNTTLTLEGPASTGIHNMNTSIGAHDVYPKKSGILYSVRVKKLTACCGVGHAVHFHYPSKPEEDKMNLLLQAIEEQNCVCSRNLSMLTLILRNRWSRPAIAAMQKRGWKRAVKFRNMVWHEHDANNSVQLWFKDCTTLYRQMMKQDNPNWKAPPLKVAD